MLARKGLSKQRLTVYVGILVVAWTIVGIVVYQNFFGGTSSPPVININLPVSVTPNNNQPNVNAPTTLNSELFGDPRFMNLKIYGEIPVEPRGLGKPNPFAREP